MTTEEKNKARKRFLEMLEELKEGEIYVVEITDESEEKEAEDEV